MKSVVTEPPPMDWVMDGIYGRVPRGRAEDHAEGALRQASRWSSAETSGSFSDETRSFRWPSERNVERGIALPGRERLVSQQALVYRSGFGKRAGTVRLAQESVERSPGPKCLTRRPLHR